MPIGWFIVITLFIALTGGAVALLVALLVSPRIGRGLAVGGVGAGVAVFAWLALFFGLFAFDTH